MRPRREEILRIIAENRDAIRACGALRLALFGSVARGEAREDSDIDLLVDVESGRSLLDIVGLWLDLQELLGRKVDLLTEGGISHHLRGIILAEARPL